MFKKVEAVNRKFYKALSKLPNQPFINAIYKKRIPAAILEFEKFILIKTSAHYVFIAGDLDEDDIDQAVNYLTQYKRISIICEEKYHHWLIAWNYKLNLRIELNYTHNSTEIPSHKYKVQFIDNMEIFSKCIWFDFISSIYGSPESFIKNGFGVALIDNNKVASETYGIYDNEICEIGIATNPDYQGQGLATIAAKHIVDECLQRKLTPYWSCYYENQASLKVALKTGFEIKQYYGFLEKF